LVIFSLVLLVFSLTLVAQEPSGADLYKAGEFERARAVLEAQNANGRATAETHFWLGYTYLALSARDQAIAEFEQYLESKPDDEDVLYALAKIYAQLADMSLQQIFRIDPASARSYQMRGIRFELESSWQEAVAQYQKAIELDASMQGIFASIGRIHEKELKDLAAARKAYAEERKRFPFNREANDFFSRQDRDAAAQKILDTCFAEPAADCKAPSAAGRAERAAMLLQQRRPQAALPLLLEWRKSEPESTDVYYYLGEAFTDLKVRTIQRLKDVRPNSFRLHQLLGESYASTHRKSDAITAYRRALALAPKVPGLNFELARLLADTETDAAVRHLKSELEIDPQHYLAKSLLGRIYVALHKPEEALPLLHEAIAARPGLIEAHKALGQALAERKQFIESLEQYDIVASANPKDEHIHFLRAQVLQELGKVEEAADARKRHQTVLNELRESSR
jgi:predicted Zn-dependent protease